MSEFFAATPERGDAASLFSKETAASAIVDFQSGGEAAIIQALRDFGFCHVRQGCGADITQKMLAHVIALDSTAFPIKLTPKVAAHCSDLFLFDAEAVAGSVLQKPAVIDREASVIRKVDPGNASSFTPFHQDTTAFQKALVNIWTPLTPAGGEYPTIELVKRRLSVAEDTMETTDGYHLVKIDDAEILRKYQGELYEAKDVAPGDCIIFLGTTIHRSTNLRDAVKTRYNLEIRWS